MGVDDELLKRFGKSKAPSFDEDKLFSPAFRGVSPSIPLKSSGAVENNVSFKELRADIKRLTAAINEMLAVFSKAHEDIKAEPTEELSKKLDRLIEQNEEIARSLLLMLELHREHIPQISRHTRVSSELRLRRPPAQLFSSKK